MQRYIQQFALICLNGFVSVKRKNTVSRSCTQVSARVMAFESCCKCTLESHRVISSASAGACMWGHEQGLRLELVSGTLHVDCTVVYYKSGVIICIITHESHGAFNI